MKIKKILYDGNENSHQLSVKQTRRIVDLLENNSKFESFIKDTRIKFQIPKKGYPFKQNQWLPEYAIENVFDDGMAFFEHCISFTKQLGFPYYWWDSIAYFAFYNVFFTPERVPIDFYCEENEEKEGLHIVVKEQLSKNELKRYLDENWDEVREKMKNLPKKVKGHKLLRPNIAKEVYALRKKKGLSFKKITDILYEKYKSKPFIDIFNEDYIKTLYHRWKKIIDKSSS